MSQAQGVQAGLIRTPDEDRTGWYRADQARAADELVFNTASRLEKAWWYRDELRKLAETPERDWCWDSCHQSVMEFIRDYYAFFTGSRG